MEEEEEAFPVFNIENFRDIFIILSVSSGSEKLIS